jgi:hypothetical protein
VSAPVDFAQLAKVIIDHGTEAHDEPGAIAQAVDAAFARFAQHASTMLGELGFRALMKRAVHLTRVCLQHEGALSLALPTSVPGESWLSLVENRGKPVAVHCASALLAHVFELLCSFIGEDLTVRLIRRTWTELDAALRVPPQGGT